MISKPLVAGLLAAGCLTGAAGGAYVAVRQNANEGGGVLPSTAVAGVPQGASPVQPVAATEAEVTPSPLPAADIEAPAATAPRKPAAPAAQPSKQPDRSARRQRDVPAVGQRRSAPVSQPALEAPPSSPAESAPPLPPPRVDVVDPGMPSIPEPVPPREPRFVQVVLPAASVIGLQVETSLSSERARVEDRVDARVTRDVSAAGRVAIPAGARVVGSVVLVERGGKMKERARLGVRFHTLVLADGSELPIRTDAIFREGDSPGSESAKKIGGATVGGAILGAILGGGKGAVIGGATGAAGGTAVVMAGDRNAATLPSGTSVTVRLSEPLFLDIERQSPEF